MPSLFHGTLLLATFLCSLVAGFLFAFAVVAMPGLGRLDDGAFLRAFQVMDRVIQESQPLFMLVWVGSAVTLLAAAIMGFGQLDGIARLLLIGVAVLYIAGVQLPTAAINVPLNNRLQTLDIATMKGAERRAARAAFEPRWNRWNVARTVVSSMVAAVLITLLWML